jgi:ketosteroid isomerase-like protein
MQQLAVLLLAAFGVQYSPSPQTSPLEDLVSTERAFAAMSQAMGTKAAFLAFLDDSSVVFRPHPVNGKVAVARQGERSTTLSWEPVVADVAASGDLGYTSGPWVLTKFQRPDTVLAYGYFVSIWIRKPGGVWRVVLDGGTVNEKPPSKRPSLTMSQTGKGHDNAGRESGGAERLNIREAEFSLSDSIRVRGAVDGYLAVAGNDFRAYRSGHFPAVGRDSVRCLLMRSEGKPQFELLFSRVSDSGDLGYAYGAYSLLDTAGESGYFVRIWRYHPGARAQLMLDLYLPVPKDKG